MIDFNIKHYLSKDYEAWDWKESDYEKKDDSFYDSFYGTIDEKPETEQEMFRLQDIYLRTKSQKAWQDLYDIAQSYMGSLIKKRLKNKKGFPADELENITTGATISFMNQYRTRKGFEIGASFAGMMDKKAMEALYSGKKDPIERSFSLDVTINDSQTKVQDLLSDEKFSDAYNDLHHTASIQDAIDIVDEVLDELDESLRYDPVLEVIVRLYVVLFFRRPKSRHAKRMFLETYAKSNQVERVINRTILEICTRLRSNIAA